ncbi:MAG TPA: hypothetical protein VH853_18925 [Polyangia bacterium]|jgi:hypothetical protein|nr:hypothetical protein [Polyangia bacterium]
MCCFSGPVRDVANTKIFARATAHERQLLAYQMTFSTATDLAMILPLPVPEGTADGALRFIDLEGYPEFFDQLKSGFPEPPSRSVSNGPLGRTAAAAPLPVEQVGSFEASFVPSAQDFARLDPRFRMPDGVWRRLPQYRSFGFAVFKLKKDAHTVHPMAFEFPRVPGGKLFFPTVHIHDGTVHATAWFDHSLYCQAKGHPAALEGWRESPQPAGLFADVKRAQGLLDKDGHCYFKRLTGTLENRDTLI